MTVMVVADLEPEVVVEAIKKNFSGGDKKPRPTSRDAGIKPYDKTRAIVASDAELTDAQLSIVWIGPPEPMATTVPLYRRDLVDSIGAWSFNRRLQKKVAEGKVNFLGGGASAGDLFGAALLAQISCRGEPGKWEQMLSELAIETQRAYLHGFSEQEVADARKEIQAGAERAVETEATLPAQAILDGWNSAITDGTPITSAAQALDITRQVLPGITAAEVGERFRKLFDTSKPVTFGLQMPSGPTAPTEEQLVAAGQKALDVKPEGEAEKERAKALLDKVPGPGRHDRPDRGCGHECMVRLARERRACALPVHGLPQGPGRGHGHVCRGEHPGNRRHHRPDRRGHTGMEPAGDEQALIHRYPRPDDRKEVRVGGGAGADMVGMSISGSPADLEFGMQLAYLLMTDPVGGGRGL
jgi:hypothetical protein